MLTDRYGKALFVEKILQEEAQIIKDLQLEVVDEWKLNDDTGELRRLLKGHFGVKQIGDGCRLTMSYVKYLRFIDMPWVAHKKKGLHLYNRIVFGRIYNDTHLRIRLAYQAALSEDLIDEIRKAMDNLNTKE